MPSVNPSSPGSYRPLGGDIRLGIVGSSQGNGHPFSWSAIFNGYDKELMSRECPFAGIPTYLDKEPVSAFGIPGARVTSICSIGDGGFTADQVAACTKIDRVVASPDEMIGEVDAVLLATDEGGEHVERARPFVEADVPVFVDKPLVTSREDLAVFEAWIREGRPIMSSSCMRYAKEFRPFHQSRDDLGDLRYISITTAKSWEKYGIHALEAIYPILGSGFLTARNTGTKERNVVHYKHRSGVDVVVVASADMYGGFGCLQLCGTKASAQVSFTDTFFAFKSQLEAFVGFLRSGKYPFAFSETSELMRMLIAGIDSRQAHGLEICLNDKL